jgi:hypothetical protein
MNTKKLTNKISKPHEPFKSSSKFKSWNNKENKKMMCVHDVNTKKLYYKNMTKIEQNHNKNMYPKLMLNKLKVM